MILAGAGIRYFSSGINNDRAYTFIQMQNKCPCWWEGPDGSRVLMMYTFQYAQADQWALTESFEAVAARGVLAQAARSYESRADYPFDAVFLHGAVERQPAAERPAGRGRQASGTSATSIPKIILSHNAEFFEYIEKHYGDKLPVYRGSAGTYWEDGAGSSARETALGPQRPRAAGQRREVAGPGRPHRRGRSRYHARRDLPGLAQLHPLRRAHLGRLLLDQPAGQRFHQGPVEDQGAVRRRRRRSSRGRSSTRAAQAWPRWCGPTARRWSSSTPQAGRGPTWCGSKLPEGMGRGRAGRPVRVDARRARCCWSRTFPPAAIAC